MIRPDKAEEVTAGGIALPSSAVQEQFTGEVIAIGPGSLQRDDGQDRARGRTQSGDRVIYSKYGILDHDFGDERLLIATPREVSGVFGRVTDEITRTARQGRGGE